MSNVRCTIVHGPLESADDCVRLDAVRTAIDPYWRQSRATDDRVTYDLQTMGLSALLGAIADHAGPGWRITVEVTG